MNVMPPVAVLPSRLSIAEAVTVNVVLDHALSTVTLITPFSLVAPKVTVAVAAVLESLTAVIVGKVAPAAAAVNVIVVATPAAKATAPAPLVTNVAPVAASNAVLTAALAPALIAVPTTNV